jgi:Flp pilus assembly pilin Flp
MLKSLIQKLVRNRKGAAFVEYALLVGGIALIGAAAVSVFGHKTSDMLAATAAILPGAHADDNAAIVSGKIIETTAGDATNPISLDVATIQTNGGTDRLGTNVLGATFAAANPDFGGLVLEPQ